MSITAIKYPTLLKEVNTPYLSESFFKLPSNFISQSIISITKSGAFASGTTTTHGPYDTVAITGGGATSYVNFNNVFKVNARLVAKLKLWVNTLNANPVIGIGYNAAPQSGDTSSGSKVMYATLANNEIIRTTGTSFYSPITTNVTLEVGSTPVVSNGDIIEVEYINDFLQGKEFFSLRNTRTGSYILGGQTALQPYLFNQAISNPAIYLADGTYTILDFTIIEESPKLSYLQIIGDSMGVGSNVPYNNTLFYYLNSLIPYPLVESANGGDYIYGMEIGQVQETVLLQPKLVLVMHYLQLLTGDFENTSPNYATYIAAFQNVMNAIVGVGATPILVKIPSWPIANQATVNAWNAFVVAQAPTYGALILDLTGITPTYDSTTFHYDGPTNLKVANLIYSLLGANNEL